MRKSIWTLVIVACLTLTGGTAFAQSGRGGGGHQEETFPAVIDLPNGFRPEGISTGRGTSFYVGSLVDGAIYRGDLRTGQGTVFIPGVAGRAATGTEVDDRNRLFVAGGATGTGRVYDAGSGRLLAEYQFAAPNAGFVNDVVVTKDAAYFTDSRNPVLYVVPLERRGAFGEVRSLPLTGAIVYGAGNNANGIEASRDGRTLLVVQSNTGLLFAVPATTGVAEPVDLHGASLLNGDGLLLRGSTLFVVRNRDNRIVQIDLDRSLRSGSVVDELTNPNFDVPTTVAPFGRNLYAVNARFGIEMTPDTTYTVVKVAVRSR